MAKKVDEIKDIERPTVEGGSPRKFGWIATLVVLSVVGLVAWFLLNGTDEI